MSFEMPDDQLKCLMSFEIFIKMSFKMTFHMALVMSIEIPLYCHLKCYTPHQHISATCEEQTEPYNFILYEMLCHEM